MARKIITTKWQALNTQTGNIVVTDKNSAEDVKAALYSRKLKIREHQIVDYQDEEVYPSTQELVDGEFEELNHQISKGKADVATRLNKILGKLNLGSIAYTMQWQFDDMVGYEWLLCELYPYMSKIVEKADGDLDKVLEQLVELKEQYTRDIMQQARSNSNSTNPISNERERMIVSMKAKTLESWSGIVGHAIHSIESTQKQIAGLNSMFGDDTVVKQGTISATQGE